MYTCMCRCSICKNVVYVSLCACAGLGECVFTCSVAENSHFIFAAFIMARLFWRLFHFLHCVMLCQIHRCTDAKFTGATRRHSGNLVQCGHITPQKPQLVPKLLSALSHPCRPGWYTHTTKTMNRHARSFISQQTQTNSPMQRPFCISRRFPVARRRTTTHSSSKNTQISYVVVCTVGPTVDAVTR